MGSQGLYRKPYALYLWDPILPPGTLLPDGAFLPGYSSRSSRVYSWLQQKTERNPGPGTIFVSQQGVTSTSSSLASTENHLEYG